MTTLTALAEQLLAQAKQVDAILEKNSIPPTSFTTDTLEQLPDDAQKLRWDLLDTTHDLRQLLRGAKLSGLDLCFGWTDQVVLRIIWRYKLAQAVPLDGSATYDEISATSGLPRSLVVRAIRSAIPLHIFDEDEAHLGQIRHSAISRLLATNEGYASVIGLELEDLGPASIKLLEAWEKFGADAGEPDQSAFSLSNEGRSLFKVLAEEPERAERFNSAMRYIVSDKDFNFSHVINGFDWSSIDKPGSRLIDLGGGYGQISQALAKHTKDLAFTVQDLPHVVEQGKKDLPAEFEKRISFEAQSFLETQPGQEGAGGADAFLISRCLHNWSDHHCTIILKALIPRLRKGAKILIWESVLEDKPIKKLSESFNLQQDFIMATIANGKDRSGEEFRQVLKDTDSRFRFEGVNKPEGSKLAMVVASWDT